MPADLQSAPVGHLGTPPAITLLFTTAHLAAGAGGGNRTRDLLLTRQLLYQLSYASTNRLETRQPCVTSETSPETEPTTSGGQTYARRRSWREGFSNCKTRALSSGGQEIRGKASASLRITGRRPSPEHSSPKTVPFPREYVTYCTESPCSESSGWTWAS